MGNISEGAYFLALQYANHKLESAMREAKLFDLLLVAIEEMEGAGMLRVTNKTQMKRFQKYRGAVYSIMRHRAQENKDTP